MSDNRRIYRIIRKAIQQLYPTSPKGNFARHLNTLAALVSGIVQGKSCQLPNLAKHAPETAKPESRIKRYSRWIKNERVDFEVFYLPFIQQILNGLANIRPLVFVMDGSEVGHECITLMVSVLYGKRALPVTMKKAGASTFTKVISMILSALPNSCWRLAWLIYGLCIWASLHFVKIGSSLFTARIAVTGAYFASDCHSLIIC